MSLACYLLLSPNMASSDHCFSFPPPVSHTPLPSRPSPPPPPSPAPPQTLRRSPLREIEDSPEHRLQLQLWEKEEDILRQRVERKENRRSSTRNEIYQLFGLYFVFQGVIVTALFTAASQSGQTASKSGPNCKYWWCPFTLSLIASLGTISAVLHKQRDQSLLEEHLEKEKSDSRALFEAIKQLREQGSSFDLEQQPEHSNAKRRLLDRVSGTKSLFRKIEYTLLRCFKGLWSYIAVVALVLVTFSAVTLLSCRLLLCDTLFGTSWSTWD